MSMTHDEYFEAMAEEADRAEDLNSYEPDPLPDEAICEECGKPCKVVNVDFGIGAYEYWGAKGNDVRIEAVSDCCEADWREV